MATMVKSFAIQGIEGYPVEIEATLLEGMPLLSIIGLGDQAVREAGERIQAAIYSAGYQFPKKKVIIRLAPGDIRKRGSHFDLGMALAILQEAEEIGMKNLIGVRNHCGDVKKCYENVDQINANKRLTETIYNDIIRINVK